MLYTLILLLDVIGLAGGAWLLWRAYPEKPRSILRDVALGMLWGCFLGVISAVAGFVLLKYFGVPRLWCHVIFCITAPLMIARGFWWMRKGNRTGGFMLALLGLLMVGTYFYARRIEPYALEINTHHIASARLAEAGFEETVRVVILADIQTDTIGDYEKRVFDEVNRLKPDLVLLAGDYLQCLTYEAYKSLRPQFQELFKRIKHRPRFGMFAIEGNVDGDDRLFNNTPVRVLHDEAIALEGAPIQVLGLTDATSRFPLNEARLASIRAFHGLTIVVGHRPDYLLEFTKFGSDVEFISTSGHTHGGQIVIPGVGAIVTLTNLPRKYVSGMHRLGKAIHCPSRGTGMERNYAPRIRLFCPPEIVVLEITAAAQ